MPVRRRRRCSHRSGSEVASTARIVSKWGKRSRGRVGRTLFRLVLDHATVLNHLTRIEYVVRVKRGLQLTHQCHHRLGQPSTEGVTLLQANTVLGGDGSVPRRDAAIDAVRNPLRLHLSIGSDRHYDMQVVIGDMAE